MFAADSSTGWSGSGALNLTMEICGQGTNRPVGTLLVCAGPGVGVGGLLIFPSVVGVVVHDARIIDNAIAGSGRLVRHIDIVP